MTTSYFGAVTGYENKPMDERNENDFYPTAPLATYALVKNYPFPNKIWEPAAGRGYMSAELIRCGYDVYSSDLFDYDDPLVNVESNRDFLTTVYKDANAVITNPPYKNDLPMKFALHALSQDNIEVVALYCRMNFIFGQRRYHNLYSKHPLTMMMVLSQRTHSHEKACASKNAHDHIGGMMDRAWFIWDKHFPTKNMIQLVDLRQLADEWNKEHENEEKNL